MISALGAVNGMIITTSRITTELGADHRLFAPLSKWSRRWGTPVRSLIVQGLVSLIIAVSIGLWFEGQNGFEALVYYTAAVFWGFFLLTGIALFILRHKEPRVARPFRVPGYPVTPFIFCLWCAYMVYGSIRFKPHESLIGLGILLAGVPFFFLPQKLKRLRARGGDTMVLKPPTTMVTPSAGK
jgi:amino acid transporter